MNPDIPDFKKNPFGGQKLKFPVTFDIKVIMETGKSIPEKKKLLAGIFDKFDIPHSGWNEKFSSAGKYISFSVNITLKDHALMDRLYASLKNEPSVKFAV